MLWNIWPGVAGIQLEYKKGSKEQTGIKRNERERLLDIMNRVSEYYERQLWSSNHAAEARDYLAERGMSEELAKTFRLGWAPGRDSMTAQLLNEGVAFQDLQALDVSVDGERGRADRFRQRLMFPICDRFGQVIAFSGRLLPKAEKDFKERGIGVGKYINSRDTPLYHKSDVVFNLHLARPAARETKRIIVMEGPTDVMAAHEHGIKECVAVLGTALTPKHAKQISQSVGQDGRVMLLFDGDAAGQNNSVKAVKTCMQAGVPSQAAILPSGQDPAELLKSDEVVAFEQVLQKRLNDIDHLLRRLAPRPYELDSREQLAVIDELLSVLIDIPDKGLVDGFFEDIAQYLNIDAIRLRRRMQEKSEQQRSPDVPPDDYFSADADDVYGYEEIEEALPDLNSEQRHVLGLIISHPSMRTLAFDQHQCEPSDFPEPWRQLVLDMSINHEMDREAILALEIVLKRSKLRTAILSLLHNANQYAADEQVLVEAMHKLHERKYEARKKNLEFQLLEAQRQGNQDRARELGMELFEMVKERKNRGA